MAPSSIPGRFPPLRSTHVQYGRTNKRRAYPYILSCLVINRSYHNLPYVDNVPYFPCTNFAARHHISDPYLTLRTLVSQLNRQVVVPRAGRHCLSYVQTLPSHVNSLWLGCKNLPVRIVRSQDLAALDPRKRCGTRCVL